MEEVLKEDTMDVWMWKDRCKKEHLQSKEVVDGHPQVETDCHHYRSLYQFSDYRLDLSDINLNSELPMI